jgi:fengycin family lipopeptide synthetase D
MEFFGSGEKPGPEELRDYLSAVLPDYMIPRHFVLLDGMPRTAHGKVNRKALPVPEPVLGLGYTAPADEIEEKLVEIWSEVLSIEKERIGVDNNFFQLGGHSLKALLLVSKIHKAFKVKLELAEVFELSSIRKIAHRMKEAGKLEYIEIKPIEEKEYYEMSYSQRRLWYINNMDPQNTAFNMPGGMTLTEAVDEKVVRKALAQLMERHESFRTTFKQVDKEPVQVIEPIEEMKADFEKLDWSQMGEIECKSKKDRVLTDESRHVFNLESGPLLRVKLIKYREEEYGLVFNMHHIISDGWSSEILKEEFHKLYEAGKKGVPVELEPIPLRYRDYVAWQNRLLGDEEHMEKAKEFWRGYISGILPELKLPYDYSIDSSDSNESAGYRVVIPAELTEKLKAMAVEHRASLFMTLLAGVNLLLSQVTGQGDIVMAIPAAARKHESLQKIVGMFVNTLIVRNNLMVEETFIEFFKRFQENTFKVLEYQDFPLELICSELKIRYPSISVFFNMINIGDSPLGTLTDFNSHHTEKVQDGKFDMVFYLEEYTNGIEIKCHYFKGRFKSSTIEKIMNLYVKTLENIIAKPEMKIREYSFSVKKRVSKPSKK